MPLRFDADYGDTSLSFEPLVDEVFAELKSGFLEMPRGEGFIDYATFERGYQALKRATRDFETVTPAAVEAAVAEAPIAFIVFRAILGFAPPEWAYITTESTDMARSRRRASDRSEHAAATAHATASQGHPHRSANKCHDRGRRNHPA
jgi:hypothetical protein